MNVCGRYSGWIVDLSGGIATTTRRPLRRMICAIRCQRRIVCAHGIDGTQARMSSPSRNSHPALPATALSTAAGAAGAAAGSCLGGGFVCSPAGPFVPARPADALVSKTSVEIHASARTACSRSGIRSTKKRLPCSRPSQPCESFGNVASGRFSNGRAVTPTARSASGAKKNASATTANDAAQRNLAK